MICCAPHRGNGLDVGAEDIVADPYQRPLISCAGMLLQVMENREPLREQGRFR